MAAKDGEAVKRMYRELLVEKGLGHAVDSPVELLTPAEARSKLGRLPRGGDGQTLSAMGAVAGEHFVLFVKKSDQGWRICGLNRL